MLPAIASLLIGASPAVALTCEQIVNMLEVKVPDNIVLQTVKDSAFAPDAAMLDCLRRNGVSPTLVESIGAIDGTEKPPPPPPPEPTAQELAMRSIPRMYRIREGRGVSQGSGRDSFAVREALNELKKNRPESAISYLYEAEYRDPSEADKVRYYRARALASLGFYHAAQHELRQVVNRGSTSPFFGYARALLVKTANAIGDRRDLIYYGAQISVEWHDSGRFLSYASAEWTYYFEEDLEGAMRELAGLTFAHPVWPEARYLEGILARNHGDSRRALRAFDPLVNETRPKPDGMPPERWMWLRANATLATAVLLEGAGQTSAAVALYEQIRAERRFYSTRYQALATWYLASTVKASGDLLQAEKLMKEVIKLQRKNAEVEPASMLELAYIYGEQNNIDAALLSAQQCISAANAVLPRLEELVGMADISPERFVSAFRSGEGLPEGLVAQYRAETLLEQELRRLEQIDAELKKNDQMGDRWVMVGELADRLLQDRERATAGLALSLARRMQRDIDALRQTRQNAEAYIGG